MIMKRRALKEKTGFDVDAAIKHMEEERAEEEQELNKLLQNVVYKPKSLLQPVVERHLNITLLTKVN